MLQNSYISTLDESVEGLKGGTQQAAARIVHAVRSLDHPDAVASLVDAHNAATGPLREWLAFARAHVELGQTICEHHISGRAPYADKDQLLGALV